MVNLIHFRSLFEAVRFQRDTSRMLVLKWQLRSACGSVPKCTQIGSRNFFLTFEKSIAPLMNGPPHMYESNRTNNCNEIWTHATIVAFTPKVRLSKLSAKPSFFGAQSENPSRKRHILILRSGSNIFYR